MLPCNMIRSPQPRPATSPSPRNLTLSPFSYTYRPILCLSPLLTSPNSTQPSQLDTPVPPQPLCYQSYPHAFRHLWGCASVSTFDFELSTRNCSFRTCPHQCHSAPLNRPLFSYSYELFCHAQNTNSRILNHLRTLSTKHPGWGMPGSSNSQTSEPPDIPNLAAFKLLYGVRFLAHLVRLTPIESKSHEMHKQEGASSGGLIPDLELGSLPAAVTIVGRGGNSHPPQLVCVILAVEDVPLLAVFENFLFLRGDFLADFQVGFFFFVQRGCQDLDYLLPDRVPVFDEFHVIARNQHVRNLMGHSDNFFAAQSHSSRLPSSLSFIGRYSDLRRRIKIRSARPGSAVPLLKPRLPQNQLAVARQLRFHLFVHFLVRNARPAHLVLVLDEDISHLFVQPVLHRHFFHHALPQSLRHGRRRLRFDQLPFHQPLHHFRGHVSYVVPCDQHPRVSPLRKSKRKSLLAAPTKCKEQHSADFPARVFSCQVR